MGNAEQEFAAFYDATWSRTIACAYAVTGDLAAAEDMAQDAYSRAWPRWSTLATYDDPGAWVRQVATRQAISRWRKGRTAARYLRRTQPLETASPGPDENTVALVTALRTLPEVQRRALVLHHLAGFSVAEIAAQERCPEGTVKARLSRGRAALVPLLDSTPNGDPTHA
jgi:RNA polymerase sigma-70 factor, ECF subfamily